MASVKRPILTVTHSDLIQQLKLSLDIPRLVRAIQRRHLILETAKAMKLTLEPECLQAAADAWRLKYNLLEAEQTWNWLRQHQLSLEELELHLQEQELSHRLAEHLFASQVESIFAQQYLDHCKVRLYEIVVQDLDLAMELFYALQAQEVTFATLARQYAATSSLRRRGGYLGRRRRGELPPELASAIFAAAPPQLLRPILYQGRSHIFYVEELSEPRLTDKRRAEILHQQFEAWVDASLGPMEVKLTIE